MSHQRGLTTSPPPSNKIPRQTSAELLDMQLNQLADNHSNGSIQEPFSKQQVSEYAISFLDNCHNFAT